MTTSTDAIEVTAATVDEAVSQALSRLGAEADNVEIEVLTTPRAGVLGLGARQARVRVTRRAQEAASSGVMSPPPAPPPKPRPVGPPPEPPKPRSVSPPVREEAAVTAHKPQPAAPPITPLPPEERPAAREMPAEEEAFVESVAEDSEQPADTRPTADLKAQIDEAGSVLKQILELMGEQATIEVVCDDDPDMLELNIKGDGSGLLIGRHGQTLDALEYVVNRIITRRIRDAAPISVDTESYRARRRGQLHRMALAKGEEAKREHQAVTLEPMPARDRRIIHLALKDDPLITTRSAGEGFMRSVEIVPVDERRDNAGGGSNRRRGRGGGPRGGGDSDRTQVAEDSGFRHGQKRII